MSILDEAWARGFKDDKMLVEAYEKYSKILLIDSKSLQIKNTFLDLSVLQKPFRDAFIKWMIYVNKPRIAKGDKPIMTLEIALKCPIWKVVKPKFTRMALTKEQFGKMRTTTKTINSTPTIKTINTR